MEPKNTRKQTRLQEVARHIDTKRIYTETSQKLKEYATSIRAEMMLRALPSFPPEQQTLRAQAKIYGVSYETVQNWVNNYGHTKLKGGDNHA